MYVTAIIIPYKSICIYNYSDRYLDSRLYTQTSKVSYKTMEYAVFSKFYPPIIPDTLKYSTS